MLIRNFQENREAFQKLFHQFNNEKEIEKISLDSISPKNAEIYYSYMIFSLKKPV